ncbi:MAG: transporter substrate-binding domain-containing protein [Oscillospiraceae bacterium]|nr:transporter substrate-binding domain-containing protein [Oscillospiraceae bacterium]
MKSHIIKRIGVLFIVMIICAACFTGCKNYDDRLERVLATKIIRFGVDADNAPISYLESNDESDSDGGDFCGLAVDIGNELAARLGAAAEFSAVEPGGAVEAIEADQIDCYLFLPVENRKDLADFTHSPAGFKQRQVVVVSAGDWIERLVDLQKSTIVAIADTPAERALNVAEVFRELTQIMLCEDYDEAMVFFEAGTARGFLVDELFFRSKNIGEMGKYRILEPPLGDKDYIFAYGLRQDAICERIASMFGLMEDDGTLDALTQKWIYGDGDDGEIIYPGPPPVSGGDVSTADAGPIDDEIE